MDPPAGSRPLPSPSAHKGENGRVLILGGSAAFTGAPLLAAIGALRAGAGLVVIGCPGALAPAVKSGWPEIMLLPLGQGAAWTPDLLPQLQRELRSRTHRRALVLGPGLPVDEHTPALVRAILSEPQRPPLVLDAGGLAPLEAACPGARDAWSALRDDDILTPHPGEAARLLGVDAEAVQADRPAALRELTSRCRAAVILKGPATLVGQGAKAPAIAPFASPPLGTGGSGDVLAGVCAACQAAGHDAFMAACLGTYLHGKAGELLEAAFPHRGNLARDIADAVAEARW